MIISTIIGSVLGIVSSTLPDVFKLVQEGRDRKFELLMLEKQLSEEGQKHLHRMDELVMTVNVEEVKSENKWKEKTWKSDIKWVDGLNGSVRPVIAYAFFCLYGLVKVGQYKLYSSAEKLPWQSIVDLWTEADQGLFAAIISFYFGQRAMQKLRVGQ